MEFSCYKAIRASKQLQKCLSFKHKAQLTKERNFWVAHMKHYKTEFQRFDEFLFTKSSLVENDQTYCYEPNAKMLKKLCDNRSHKGQKKHYHE